MQGRRYARAATVALVLTVTAAAACSKVELGPEVPASLEFIPFAAPAIAVGDTLRDSEGVAAPVKALVRNQAGELLDVPVLYTYADGERDTAIVVDPERGFVVSRTALSSTSATARISARAGESLQAIRTVMVTLRPDTLYQTGSRTLDTLKTTLPDTGATGATQNTSAALTVNVRNFQTTTTTIAVPNWLVKYELVRPANPGNDTTANVFLVNDNRRGSTLDTTDVSGIAARYVRVRAANFPAGTAPDFVTVRATATYQGKPLKGSPIEFVVPVVKKAVSTTP